MNENQIGDIVVKKAVSIHKNLGPGLLESVYEKIIAYELKEEGLNVKIQVPIDIQYKEIFFKNAFKADIIIEDKVILELKSLECLNNAHKKQLLTYLKLSNLKLGYLLNFGEELMKYGITRIINGKL